MGLADTFGDIGKTIKRLFGEIKQLDGRISSLEHRNTSGSSAAMPHGGRNKGLCPMIFYPVKVSNVAEDGSTFDGTRQIPGDDGWEDDTDLSDPLTVDVSSPSPPPRDDDIVLAHFMGAVDGEGKYSFFDRMVEVSGVETSITAGVTVNPCRHIYFETDDFIVLQNEDDQWQADVYLRTTVGSVEIIVTTVTVVYTVMLSITSSSVETATIYPVGYAKALGDYEVLDGRTAQVFARLSDIQGVPLDPNAIVDFNILIFYPPGLYPAVFTNDVIGWLPDYSLTPVCVTDACDDAMNTVKHWSGDEANVPKGWSLFLTHDNVPKGDGNERGRVLLGVSLFDNEDLYDMGGFRTHGSDANNHIPHIEHSHDFKLVENQVAFVPDPFNLATVFVASGDIRPPEEDPPLEEGEPSGMENHGGPFNNQHNKPGEGTTDNRPQYVVFHHIIRSS